MSQVGIKAWFRELVDIRPAKPIAPIEDPAMIARLFRRLRTSIIIAMTMGYGVYYTCRLGLSVVKKPLIDSGIMTPEQLGQIGSALFYGYALGKFFNGFLADYANVRKLFSIGLFLSALCNLVFGLSNIFWLLVALWALNGWFQGIGGGCCGVSLANWFTFRERGRYYGIWSTSHSIGEGLTFVVSSIVVTYWGWRWGFLGPAAAGMVFSVILYALMRDRPASCGLPRIADWRNEHGQIAEPANEATFAAQLSIFKNPAIWVLCICSALLYISRYAVSSWGVLYLQESRGLSATQAGWLLGLNTMMGIAGGILYGLLSDVVFRGRRPPATLVYCILELVSLVFIFILPTRNYAILTAAFGLFGFAIGGLLLGLCGLLAVDIAPKKAAGAVLGVVGIFSYIAAAIQESVSGRLIQQHIRMIDGVRHYDFQAVVVFWVGSAVLAMVLGLTLWKAKVEE